MSTASGELTLDEPRSHRPPSVVDNEPPSTLAGLGRELRPAPGRAVNALRLTVMGLLIVAICEIFRIPNAATAAYIAFIVVKSDADAAIPAAVLCGIAIVAGILASIVYFAATLSEPALRIPLMAVITFGAVFLFRASSLGLAAFVSGLFMVICLTQGDDVAKGGLGPYNDANAERHGLPDLAYMPPEEALVHNLLWSALAVSVAAVVILVVSRLTLSDPERKLRAILAERLEMMADVCAGHATARDRLADVARRGATALKAQNMLAGKLKRGRYRPAFGTGVIDAVSRLTLALLAFGRLPDQASVSTQLAPFAPRLTEAAAAIRSSEAPPAPSPAGRDATPDQPSSPLIAEFFLGLEDLDRAIDGEDEGGEATAGAGLFKGDAFSNPEHVQFALKVTLALMASYLFMDLSDWSQISTCMTTCYVLAASGVGQSVHKMALRISGALAGAAVGFVTILLVMPALTDLGQFLGILAPVLLVAAWIRVGSERTNYFGQQMAFAFLLMVVQDYGPTLDFQAGRNRLVGILVGEVAFTLVFLHLWPVSVGTLVRSATSMALRHLAEALSSGDRRSCDEAIQAFVDTLEQARTLVADVRYEPGRIRRSEHGATVDADALLGLQSLAIPAAILGRMDRDGEAEGASSCESYLARLAAWMASFAGWVTAGGDADTLVRSRPLAPALAAGEQGTDRLAWCRTLDADLGAAMSGLGLGPRPL